MSGGGDLFGVIFGVLCSLLVHVGVDACNHVLTERDVEEQDDGETKGVKKKEEKEDCISNCCYFMCCICCGCTFCCSKQPVDRSILYSVIAFWIFAVFVGTGMTVKYGFSDKVNFNLTVGDEQLVDVSHLFCQAQTVYTVQGKAPSLSIYYLDDKPQINSTALVAQSLNIPQEAVGGWGGVLWHSFYLLEGSKVDVSITADNGLRFWLFKGSRNFQSFQKDDCDSCADVAQTLRPDGAGQYRLDYSYTAASSDYYYYLVKNEPLQTAQVTFGFQLKRTTYDLRNALAFVSSIVYVEFPSWSSGYMVVRNPATGDSASAASFTARCESRLGPYFLIFMLLPLSLLIVSYLLVFGRTLPSWWPWCQSHMQGDHVHAINTITQHLDEEKKPITSQPI